MTTVLLRAYVWIRERKGQTLAEYGLLLAFIAIVAEGAYAIMGTSLKSMVAGISASF